MNTQLEIKQICAAVFRATQIDAAISNSFSQYIHY